MTILDRVKDLFRFVLDDGEAHDVSRIAIRQQQISSASAEVSKQAREASGRLRDAARAVKSTSTAAFSDFERAVRHRD